MRVAGSKLSEKRRMSHKKGRSAQHKSSHDPAFLLPITLLADHTTIHFPTIIKYGDLNSDIPVYAPISLW